MPFLDGMTGDEAAERNAGASARREHARRKANREARVRERHPRIGGALLALGGDPPHERAWERGAEGEERVAAILGARLDDGVRVLHDRRIPGSRANIDHIAVGPSGVWVIDTKRYRGRVDVSKPPLFGSAKLTVGGRDRTALVGGVARQVALVTAAAAEIAPGVPVHGVLCFVEGDLPLLGTLRVGDVRVIGPKRLAKVIDAGGDVSPRSVEALRRALASWFPEA